jgi:glycerol dehydrogenase
MYSLGFPRLYLQGYGIFDRIGEEVRRFGSRPLVVADAFVRSLLGERIIASFEKAGIPCEMLQFAGECSPRQIDLLTSRAKDFHSDVLVAVGGGKTLDVTKGIALNLGLPVVIAPTLASNDAPTSRVIVTYTDEGEWLGPRFLALNPDCIFVDSQIISQAPARFFASGIADALATYYEAQQCLKKGADNFYNGKQTVTSQAIARICHETIWQYGKEAYDAVRRKECTESVEKVIEANILLSGVGFEGCGVAAAHGIGLSLSVLTPLYGDAKGLLHGEEVALGILAQFVLEGRSAEEIGKLQDFLLSLDLPISFEQAGIADFNPEKVRLVAEASCKPKSRIWNMAVPVSVELVENALNTVASLGRARLARGAAKA